MAKNGVIIRQRRPRVLAAGSIAEMSSAIARTSQKESLKKGIEGNTAPFREPPNSESVNAAKAWLQYF